MERNYRHHYLFLLGQFILVLNSVGNFFMGLYEENYVTWIIGFVTACVAALLLYGVQKQSQKASSFSPRVTKMFFLHLFNNYFLTFPTCF